MWRRLNKSFTSPLRNKLKTKDCWDNFANKIKMIIHHLDKKGASFTMNFFYLYLALL